MMSTSVPLQLTDITVAFQDGPSTRTVLDSLQLQVNAGELVVVSGPSGSGKSTLLTVTGLLRSPDSGEVTVAGIETSALKERQRTTVRREHIAIIYQSANLLPALTAIEQLELVGHIRSEKMSETKKRAAELLGHLDLADRANQLPNQLSGGERQRVGIARALMARPSVLLADEPTASLDPERAAIVANLIADATKEHGLATVVVAHDDAHTRADRRLFLKSGVLQADPDWQPSS